MILSSWNEEVEEYYILKCACFGFWLIERGILLLKHFSGSCFALWLI